jgi:hypothetical protein
LRRGELAAAYGNAKEAVGQVIHIRDTSSKMSAHAVLAHAAVLSGHLEEAAEQIDAGLAHMQRLLPAAPSYQLVYSSMLLASLALLQKAPSGAARAAAARRVRQAILGTAQFAGRFPIGWSQVFLGVGGYLGLHGQHRAARAVLLAGLPISRRYRMRHDEGLLHLWIATLGAANGAAPLPLAERTRHLDSACQLFQALGAQHELAVAQALLPPS